MSKQPKKRWVHHVMATSFALSLPQGIFTGSAKDIARGLKQSAEASTMRKGSPFQSAMSMLNFYINRAGKNLKPHDKARLERAKNELRKLYGREPKRLIK